LIFVLGWAAERVEAMTPSDIFYWGDRFRLFKERTKR
jgi:hypothetical protein